MLCLLGSVIDAAICAFLLYKGAIMGAVVLAGFSGWLLGLATVAIVEHS